MPPPGGVAGDLTPEGNLGAYIDRAVMGVAAPTIVSDLGLSAITMGLIFSAFSWTYALAQIPGGALLDHLGTRLTYAASLMSWSLFTLLHGIATGAGALLAVAAGCAAGFANSGST